MDAKALAMLGVLAAVGAALRPLGAGTAGIETVFFLLVLAGRVYGPAFGFVLGSTTLFASALLTGGVGPWLPFQMLASAWVGLGAGLLPRRLRGRAEIAMLAVYGAVAALAYGFLMNMWFWPFATGSGTELSFVPGGAVLENLHRFLLYSAGDVDLGLGHRPRHHERASPSSSSGRRCSPPCDAPPARPPSTPQWSSPLQLSRLRRGSRRSARAGAGCGTRRCRRSARRTPR